MLRRTLVVVSCPERAKLLLAMKATALEHGNAPARELEHYRNGDQDRESVVRSVMCYHGCDNDDTAVWSDDVVEAMTLALTARERA